MGKAGAVVWWIEEDTGEKKYHRFHTLPNSGSYEFEVGIKYAVKPVNIVVITMSDAGSEWAKKSMEDLSAKSQMIRDKLNEKN